MEQLETDSPSSSLATLSLIVLLSRIEDVCSDVVLNSWYIVFKNLTFDTTTILGRLKCKYKRCFSKNSLNGLTWKFDVSPRDRKLFQIVRLSDLHRTSQNRIQLTFVPKDLQECEEQILIQMLNTNIRNSKNYLFMDLCLSSLKKQNYTGLQPYHDCIMNYFVLKHDIILWYHSKVVPVTELNRVGVCLVEYQ